MPFQNLISIGISLPPIVGRWFFVNPNTTSTSNSGANPLPGNNGNSGYDERHAVADLKTAYGLCVDGRGDGIAILSNGTTSAMTTSYLTAALTWAKSGITVCGVCSGSRFSQRARIANASTALTLANLLTVSGDNNAFYNLSFYNGGTTGAGGVMVTGKRNYFKNVHFMGGMGMTTPTVNDYDLYLNGSQENTFEGCTIGSDTFDKSDIAGADLLVGGGSERDRFFDCEFISFRSAGTTAGLVGLVGAGDSITRTLRFTRSFFHMYRDGAVTAEGYVVIGTAPNNGFIIFDDCRRHGFTAWGAAASRIYSGSPAVAATGGITVITG